MKHNTTKRRHTEIKTMKQHNETQTHCDTVQWNNTQYNNSRETRHIDLTDVLQLALPTFSSEFFWWRVEKLKTLKTSNMRPSRKSLRRKVFCTYYRNYISAATHYCNNNNNSNIYINASWWTRNWGESIGTTF